VGRACGHTRTVGTGRVRLCQMQRGRAARGAPIREPRYGSMGWRRTLGVATRRRALGAARGASPPVGRQAGTRRGAGRDAGRAGRLHRHSARVPALGRRGAAIEALLEPRRRDVAPEA
jgi:hypothetical protein